MSNVTTLGVVVLAAAISAGGCGVQKTWESGWYREPPVFARLVSPAITQARLTFPPAALGESVAVQCPGLPSGRYMVAFGVRSTERISARVLDAELRFVAEDGSVLAVVRDSLGVEPDAESSSGAGNVFTDDLSVSRSVASISVLLTNGLRRDGSREDSPLGESVRFTGVVALTRR
jgi:hypothetical protein